MGTYTELVLKCEVKENLPPEVEAVLQYCFNDASLPVSLPNHSFFKSERWPMIGHCSSFYHTPFSISKYDEGYIFSRSDLKNYDSEIVKFIDWLIPYISQRKDCIGWHWSEEAEAPTLILIGDHAFYE